MASYRYRQDFFRLVRASQRAANPIKNVPGSSAEPSCPVCGPWIDHWKTFSGEEPGLCANSDCNKQAKDGGHVTITGKDGEWIVPLCKTCNHPSKTEEMSLRSGVIAVPVDHAEAMAEATALLAKKR